MYSRPLLWVFASLVVLSVVAPRAAYAQTTGLFFDSQPGDFIGGGSTRLFNDGTFTASPISSVGTVIYVTGPSHAYWWTLQFKAAGGVTAPSVGVYEGARSPGFDITPVHGLSVSGSGAGCNTLTGRFVVLEAEYDGHGGVVRFAADFEQHCEDMAPGLFGAIRYNSTIANMVPFGGAYPLRRLTLVPPSQGTLTGDGLTCGTGGSHCVADHASATTVGIDATPDPGYVFAGWGLDCIGGPHATVNVNMQRACSATFLPIVPAEPRTIAVLMGIRSYDSKALASVLSPANSIWTLSAYGTGFTLKMGAGGLQPNSNTFHFQAPTGQTFQAGVEYPTASSGDLTHAWFSAEPDSLEMGFCGGTGTLAIREWVANPGEPPSRFSLDFTIDCPGLMTGTIQYAATYGYGVFDVNPRELHFVAVHDQFGIVSHSADQAFRVAPPASSSGMQWQVQSDQPWLTAAPRSDTGSSTAAARVKTGVVVAGASPATGHLQVIGRGMLNIPERVTVTLVLVPPDTTIWPFALFRSASGGWMVPNQGPQQIGQPGDIPLSGDFDGNGTPDIAIYRPGTSEWFAQGHTTRQWGLPGDVPVPADYDGDGITDVAVFRQSGPLAQWFIAGESAPRTWGLRGDIPVPGDYDGDRLADLAIFRPATGTWWIVRSSSGQAVAGVLGVPGDIPLVADFDGDRIVDLTVFRPSTGFWYITLSRNGALYSNQFGLPGDIPVPHDVTGDGRADLRVWRPSTGTWYAYDFATGHVSSQQYGQPGDVPVMTRAVVTGSRPADVDGDLRADVTVYRPSTGEWFTRQSATGYSTFTVQPWGVAGDISIPGDYDGDRRADSAVYHPSTSEWFVRRFDGTLLQRAWGLPDDVAVPADYDGDGRTDMAVYRPASGQWFILTSASDYGAAVTLSWGLPEDRPVPADFDGDGRADAAVYRPSTGEWFVAPSSGGWFVRQWGLSGDVPIARDFDGDGRADLAVFRPATGLWYVMDAASGSLVFMRQWGLTGDVPVADDYDGDGAADVAVYRPSSGDWFVIRSSDGGVLHLQWGLTGDLPVTRR